MLAVWFGGDITGTVFGPSVFNAGISAHLFVNVNKIYTQQKSRIDITEESFYFMLDKVKDLHILPVCK